uniref:Uncharacterized protein n=1 Tax=Macrostomum lignano TaxID=282301 RepID=A0A1I8HZI8_9PLAT
MRDSEAELLRQWALPQRRRLRQRYGRLQLHLSSRLQRRALRTFRIRRHPEIGRPGGRKSRRRLDWKLQRCWSGGRMRSRLPAADCPRRVPGRLPAASTT